MAGKMMFVLLLSIMVMDCVPGGLDAKETAAEVTIAADADEEEMTENQDEPDGQPETEEEPEAEGEQEPKGEPEKPPLPEKTWAAFGIQIAAPDGFDGYYITRPNIEIQHMDTQGSTNYFLISESGELIRGIISGKDEKIIIPAAKLKEGVQRLVVYMHDDNGEQLEDGTGNYGIEKEIRVDTIAPKVKVTAPSGFESWYQDEVTITVNANDTGSGINEIRYYVNGLKVKTQTLQGEKASSIFTVVPPSDKCQKLPVKIEVLDRAGNLTVIHKGLYIDKQDPQITITGARQHEITSSDIKLNVQAGDENGIASWRMTGEREEADGTIRMMEQTNEKTLFLSAEGIYRMEFEAVDLAGRRSATNFQVIIDKTDPVIRLIDELKGAHIRAFRLNASEEEMIEEFTSYDLVMSLNGRLYHAQETIYDEGQQLLKVKVKDAAGNEARTEARFTIDRTKPVIIFSGITDGQEYEGKADVEIEVENKEDVLEDVRVNGRKMTVEAGAFQGDFKDAGEYKVTAVAADKAGNTTKGSIVFTVKSDEKAWVSAPGMFQRILGKKAAVNEDEEKMPRWQAVIIVMLVLAVVIVLGLTAVYKLRKTPR